MPEGHPEGPASAEVVQHGVRKAHGKKFLRFLPLAPFNHGCSVDPFSWIHRALLGQLPQLIERLEDTKRWLVAVHMIYCFILF